MVGETDRNAASTSAQGSVGPATSTLCTRYLALDYGMEPADGDTYLRNAVSPERAAAGETVERDTVCSAIEALPADEPGVVIEAPSTDEPGAVFEGYDVHDTV